jgi:hypothetical protein
METMERKRPRPRRAFTEEFKADIVERCLKGDRSINQVVQDDLTDALIFIDDDQWSERTAKALEITQLHIAALAPEQAIQVVLHVSGGLHGSLLPALIGEIRRYRSVDRVAVYSDDRHWRLGVTADEPAWYLHRGRTLTEYGPVRPGTIEALIASNGVLASLFAAAAQVA